MILVLGVWGAGNDDDASLLSSAATEDVTTAHVEQPAGLLLRDLPVDRAAHAATLALSVVAVVGNTLTDRRPREMVEEGTDEESEDEAFALNAPSPLVRRAHASRCCPSGWVTAARIAGRAANASAAVPPPPPVGPPARVLSG